MEILNIITNYYLQRVNKIVPIITSVTHPSMFDKLDDFTQQDSKGLFTFYREQAEQEQQMRRRKKQRKVMRAKQTQEKKKRELQQDQKILKSPKQLQNDNLNKVKNDQKSDRERPNLYEPKNRREKFNKQQIGSSVVIVNFKDSTNEARTQPLIKSNDHRTNLKKIQELINPHNNNRYFLQNKELPVSFGKMSLEKMIVKNQQQKQVNSKEKEKEKESNRKKFIQQSYFNHYSNVEQDKKYIPTFSYDKLPQLTKNKPSYSQIILPKRYKSKKIEAALKSNNSELIRQIRESIREQSIMCHTKEDVSYLQLNLNAAKQINNYQKQYENRLNSRLDAKQRRLIDILRNSSQRRQKYQ